MEKITTATIPMKTVKNQRKEKLCTKFDASDDDERYSTQRNRTEEKKKHGEGTRKHKGRSGAHRNHNEKECDALVKRHPNLTKVLFFTSCCLC